MARRDCTRVLGGLAQVSQGRRARLGLASSESVRVEPLDALTARVVQGRVARLAARGRTMPPRSFV
eukprot:11049537-Alexandrium_andersonii.AAC.1